MDKDRARITIKLGQAESKDKLGHVKNEIVKEVEPVIPVTEEELAQSPLLAHEEIAVGGENHEQPVDSFGPVYTPSKKSHSKRSRRGGARNVVTITASVIGAVTLGLIFGIVVLNFLKSGYVEESVAKPKAMEVGQSETEKDVQQPAKIEVPAPGSAESQKTTQISVEIPERTYVVIQGGVFKDRANAEQILTKVKSQGWPNVLVGDQSLYLLLGITANRDNALAMANHYKDLDVYIKDVKEESKTVNVPLREGAVTTQQEWDKWFDKESQFFKSMGQAVGQCLTTGKLTGDTMNSVTSAHRELLQQGKVIIDKLPKDTQEVGNRLLNDYTKGVTAMERYEKQPDNGYLWQAEQSLLDAYVSKKQLFSMFK